MSKEINNTSPKSQQGTAINCRLSEESKCKLMQWQSSHIKRKNKWWLSHEPELSCLHQTKLICLHKALWAKCCGHRTKWMEIKPDTVWKELADCHSALSLFSLLPFHLFYCVTAKRSALGLFTEKSSRAALGACSANITLTESFPVWPVDSTSTCVWHSRRLTWSRWLPLS